MLVVLAAGCSDDDESTDGARTTATAEATTPTREATAPERRKAAKKPAKKRAPSAAERRRAGARRARELRGRVKQEQAAAKREAAADRREDRRFDEAVEQTPLEQVLDGLPVREPPLYVQQYVTVEGSHRVYTVVEAKRFFCGRSPARRKAAVTAFYRSADRRFRRAGIDDFVQVVAPVGGRAGELPALAVARKGSVRLTARGRAKGPC